MKIKFWGSAIVTGVAIGGAFSYGAWAGSDNDRVLGEDKYIEVFKKEGRGDKNYLYTITEFEDAHGRQCTVVTGASETSIAIDCDRRQG